MKLVSLFGEGTNYSSVHERRLPGCFSVRLSSYGIGSSVTVERRRDAAFVFSGNNSAAARGSRVSELASFDDRAGVSACRSFQLRFAAGQPPFCSLIPAPCSLPLQNLFPRAGGEWHNSLLTIFNLLCVRSPIDGECFWSGVAEGAGGWAAGACKPECGGAGGDVAEARGGAVGGQWDAGGRDRGADRAESQGQVHRGRRGDARAGGLGQGEQGDYAGAVWGAAGAGGGGPERSRAVWAGPLPRGR